MFVAVSLGPVPLWSRRRKTAHDDRYSRIHSCIHRYHSRPSSDVLVLDKIVPQPGSYIVMDRGYIDFERLYRFNQAMAYFVIRAKGDLQFTRRESHPIDKSTGLRSDQTIALTGPKSSLRYPIPLRRVSY